MKTFGGDINGGLRLSVRSHASPYEIKWGKSYKQLIGPLIKK
jgi:hypothetical protein